MSISRTQIFNLTAILAFSLISTSVFATEVRIAYPATGTIVSAQIGLIFEKTDILKKHGFESKVTGMGTGRESKMALVSNQVDVILTSEANFLVLLGEGFDARAINTLGSAGRVALVVKNESPYKKLADLKGKTVGTIFGTSLHQPGVQWSKLAGGYNLVNISQTSALRTALETGAADAVISLDPFLADPLKEGQIRIIQEDHFELITVASADYVKTHGAEIAKLNDAFRDAVIYMRKNKDEVNGWFSKVSKLSPSSIDASSLYNLNYKAKPDDKVDLSISSAYIRKLENVGEFLVQEKLVKERPDVKKHIWSKK